MPNVVIKINGLENIVEEMKRTKIRCTNENCINHAGWIGRSPYAPNSGRCLLPEVEITNGCCSQYEPDPSLKLVCIDCDPEGNYFNHAGYSGETCPKCNVRFLRYVRKE